ncbi:hypothetical protein ACS0TY_034203 [Phlomoides rotata]
MAHLPGSEKVSDQESGKSARRRLLEDKDTKGNEDVHAATVENDGGLEADADSSFEIFRDNDELADEDNYDYDDYVDESMWGDEEWTETQHEQLEDYVLIDAHVLCTPIIADIDNDGISEMVVAVSYFFDRQYYDNPEHLKELGGIDIGKYVAGGIVVFNLNTKQVKWSVQLDQSTDTGNFRAYIYSSPTVSDLDGDGNLDILVDTSFGLFYVLDHKSKVKEKFPLEMAEIQGAVVAADINDRKIELVTADAHGNVVAWTPQGKLIWETHVKSLVPQVNEYSSLKEESLYSWADFGPGSFFIRLGGLWGNDAYHAGQFSKAEEFYSTGINSAPHVSAIGYSMRQFLLCYSNRAATRMSLGRMREAIEDCTKASALDPDFLKATLGAGNCYLVLGEVEDAIICYTKCLSDGTSICLDRRVTIEAADGLHKAKVK